jgi:PAS domain S-box-containing protein
MSELVADLDKVARTVGRVPYTVLLERLVRSPCAALLADKVGVLVFTNQAASQLTGYSLNELRGMSFLQLTPDAYEGEAELLWRAFVERGAQSGTYHLLANGGRIISVVYAAKTNILPGFHLSLMQAPSD